MKLVRAVAASGSTWWFVSSSAGETSEPVPKPRAVAGVVEDVHAADRAGRRDAGVEVAGADEVGGQDDLLEQPIGLDRAVGLLADARDGLLHERLAAARWAASAAARRP